MAFWNCIERVLKKIPASYQFSSLFIGIIIYLYYEYFSMMLKSASSGSYKISILFVSISITLQLFGIQYFLNKMRGSFGELIVESECKDKCLHPVDQLRKNFTTSKILYLLILVAFLSLAAAKIDAFYSGLEPFLYLRNPTFWALALDIYNNTVSLFIIYLLATLLWMTFNISYIFFKINKNLYNSSLRIEPLDSDRAGGLIHLKELLLQFSVFYFLIAALAALTNFSNTGLSILESLSISLFWLTGSIFFLYDWYAFRSFIRGKIEDEVSILSKILDSKRTHLLDLLSKNEENENKNQDQINLLSNSLDIINKERDRIQQYKLKLIDARTIILFAGSSTISLITILKASGEDGKSNIAIFVIDNVQPYINYIANFVNQFLLK